MVATRFVIAPLLFLIIFDPTKANLVKNVKIFKFIPCKLNEPQLAVFNSSTFRIKGGRNKLLMNGYGELTDDLISPLTVTFDRTKCVVRTGECEQHNSITIPDSCYLMMMPQVLAFFGKFRPSIKECPVKKGPYVVDNVEVDMSFFANLPMNGLRYETSLMVRTNGRVGFCINLHWTMTNARPIV